MGSEGHQDIDLAILTALLKGNICKFVDTHMHLWTSKLDNDYSVISSLQSPTQLM